MKEYGEFNLLAQHYYRGFIRTSILILDLIHLSKG